MPYAIKARYVFPVTGPPIAGGVITAIGNFAVEMDNWSGLLVKDLGDVAIIPGLVNAHTHLEFSDLDAPLGQPGMSLPDWIRLVVTRRQESHAGAGQATSNGLTESGSTGTVLLGDVTTQTLPSMSDSAIEIVVFHELIAPTAARVPAAINLAERFLKFFFAGSQWQPGLSPHAPYSVHPAVLDRCADLSRLHKLPLAMHVAESREEIEYLRTGGGPFRHLLEDLGTWEPPQSGFTRPMDYLGKLAEAQRSLVIHGNYLDEDEIGFVAEQRDKMSVVYCPRTHAYFGHAKYPLARMLAAGVNMAVGTDSRASNPDLNLLEELKFMARSHPEVDPRAILEAGTHGGLRALGHALQNAYEGPRGFRFRDTVPFCLVNIGLRTAADPYELLFADEARVVPLVV